MRPGYLVAVGYMDPGNWATSLAGGSAYNYTLLSVILISNFMAIILQALSAKLGIVTGRDLAQACHDHFSKPVSFVLWILCELAIVACDLAEVIGAAIALNLLFHVPLVWGVCITSFDILLILLLQNKGFRYIEVIVISLIAIIPAVIITLIYGEKGTTELLVLSQVILSLQLSFAVIPLVMFTSDKKKMGEFTNSLWTKVIAWFIAIVIAILNVYLLYTTFLR